MKVEPIPAFADNYFWAIRDEQKVAIVDPGDAKPVLAYLSQNNLELETILVTHHHSDHIGGIEELVEKFPQVKVYSPSKNNFSFRSVKVSEGEKVNLGALGIYRIIDVPGHTLGHIAYYGEGNLFIGDTVFACGCGRLFEGTAAQMVDSFEKIRQLPLNTNIYCAHEYTLSNIRFAKVADPSNCNLMKREEDANLTRRSGMPTVPFTLAEELVTNPFFRCHLPEIQQVVSEKFNLKNPSVIETFAALRNWKNNF